MKPEGPSPSSALVPRRAKTPIALARRARACQACDLYARATQTVFGEGPAPASFMLVGEQPGDREDQLGKPFVGPAGRLLDEILAEAGIPRDDVYVTNAVKHFKWEPRGKRRLHARPNVAEIHACHGWLEAELRVVAPRVVVCLGATAARALVGRDFKMTRDRGVVFETPWAEQVVVTYHPSAVLRASKDPARREALLREIVDDLRRAAGRVLPTE